MALVDRHTNDFLQEAKKLFPEIRPEINEHQGLFHLQIAALARIAQQAISSQAETYIQVTELVGRYFYPENGHLEAFNNAVYVSFLEHLFFDVENGDWAWELMPVQLQTSYTVIMEALERNAPRKLPHLTRKERFAIRKKKSSIH